MPEISDPIGQLSDVTRDTVARLERLGAELVALRGRVVQVESRQEAGHAGTLDQGQRIETLRTEVGRLGRLESAISELHSEISRRLDAQQAESQAALQGLRSATTHDMERLGREAGLQQVRIEALEGLSGRLDALHRERAALARAVAAAEERTATALEERQSLHEEHRRLEQRLGVRLEAVQTEVRELSTELAAWRGRLEGQEETVREARSLAKHLQEEMARMREDHRNAAEAARMFEQRVDGLLATFHRENTEDWARFQRERGADWAQLGRDNEARDQRGQLLTDNVESILTRLDAVEQELRAGLGAGSEALTALRQDLAAALGNWRQALGEATEIVEHTVGQSETSASLEERRKALRRALRAQRTEGEG